MKTPIPPEDSKTGFGETFLSRSNYSSRTGIPAELFTDPVLSRAVLDDNMFSTQGEHEYGVDEPFRSDDDDADIGFDSLTVVDPLEEHDFLCAIRDAYFEELPLDPDSDGIGDYLRYRIICLELLAAIVDFPDGEGGIDWEAFGVSVSPHPSIERPSRHEASACVARARNVIE